MKKGIFSRLALSNIRKNYRYYVPYILMGAGLTGCMYIILTLSMDKSLAGIHGGDYILGNMVFGSLVTAILSFILILYTNSFLMKQRRKEFGLYSVLGMNRRHIGRVLFYESLYSALVSMIAGLCFGMLFYRLCALLICRIMKAGSVLGLKSMNPASVMLTALFFCGCYAVSYVINRLSVAGMKPAELLKSPDMGEKEPSSRPFLFILGLISLGAGYVIALTVDDPLEALIFFFAAVILVIIGTYCLFTAGSIFILKRLRNCRRYYYDRRHMMTVSGLLFRMKQNAAGLASICILSTCVLVMCSTTMSLYAGMNGTVDRGYPQHVYLDAAYFDTEGNRVSVDADELVSLTRDAAASFGIGVKESFVQNYLEVSYALKDGNLYADSLNIGERINAVIMTASEYERSTGLSLRLEENEVAVCPYEILHPYTRDRLSEGGDTYSVAELLETFPVKTDLSDIVSCYGIVVSDETVLERFYDHQREAYGSHSGEITGRAVLTFADRDAACEAGSALNDKILEELTGLIHSRPDYDGGDWLMDLDTVWDAIDNVYGLYGTLLFLGIILGIVFIFATVLIIYYKQISEGYEDRERFQIMEKIGMSGEEVRKTVRDQLLTVFYLPLLAAGVHMLFAFPILKLILVFVQLSSELLFAKYAVIVYVIFALVYTVIYSGTSKVYYKIVR